MDFIGISSVLVELIVVAFQVLYHIFNSFVKNFLPISGTKTVNGEVILVTGAGSGLGRMMAQKLALRHGATVVCVDVNASANQETANNIKADSGSAVAFTCDLTDPKEVEALASAVKANVGDVDILVNNAGVVTGKEFLESSNKMNRLTMAVNTESHFWTTKAFLPPMIEKNHGHIVTIASGAGLMGVHKLADYCASKFGAVGFAESLMSELYTMGKDGVKSTLVCPYFISTGMFDGVSTRFPCILPILTPDYVTDRIIDAVLTNQEILLMPRILYVLVFFKSILPVKAGHVVMKFLGAGEMMAHFVGRPKND